MALAFFKLSCFQNSCGLKFFSGAGKNTTGILIKQPFTSFTLVLTSLYCLGMERLLAIKQKVKYARVKSNLCSGSDILRLPTRFQGSCINATP